LRGPTSKGRDGKEGDGKEMEGGCYGDMVRGRKKGERGGRRGWGL